MGTLHLSVIIQMYYQYVYYIFNNYLCPEPPFSLVSIMITMHAYVGTLQEISQVLLKNEA